MFCGDWILYMCTAFKCTLRHLVILILLIRCVFRSPFCSPARSLARAHTHRYNQAVSQFCALTAWNGLYFIVIRCIFILFESFFVPDEKKKTNSLPIGDEWRCGCETLGLCVCVRNNGMKLTIEQDRREKSEGNFFMKINRKEYYFVSPRRWFYFLFILCCCLFFSCTSFFLFHFMRWVCSHEHTSLAVLRARARTPGFWLIVLIAP